MKLVGKHIERDGSGSITLIPDDNEDLYTCYNLIQVGDELLAKTDRKVHSTSSTGSTTSFRVQMRLNVKVVKTAFSAAASSETSGDQSEARAVMNITGQVTEANDYVRIGAFHTLELERGKQFRLTKTTGWDSIALSQIEESTRPGRGADVGAIVCGEGTAALCLLSDNMTVVRQRIECPVPRKRSGTSSHDKAMANFLQITYNAILRLIPYEQLKVIVIASPGFTKDTLFDYIFQQATLSNNKQLLASRPKWVKVHSNTPHVHSLVESLRDPSVTKMMSGAKFAREGVALDKFHKMLATDELRAWYGPDHVAMAVERGAVGTLLISDDLFRAAEPETRNKYVQMVDDVRARGGEAVIFSSMHESGVQLNLLTGIAAILTYPLDIEVVEMEEKEEKERLEAEAEAAASGATTPMTPATPGSR